MSWNVDERDLAAFLHDNPRCYCGRRSTRRVAALRPDGVGYEPAPMCAGHAADLEDELGA
jgi:hypothetical protein